MKYNILMPYYNRADQLDRTLLSFEELYSGRNDFEISIIEDYKGVTDEKKHLELVKILQKHSSLWIRLLEFPMEARNPAPLFNWGAGQSKGEYLVLTNPECRHKNDVLAGFDEELSKGDVYVVAACESLSKEGKFDRWYQHSKHRSVQYHFCSCISSDLYFRIGGFPGYFYDGIAYDDDAFLWRVKESDIPIVERDDLIVQHQWHPKEKIDKELLLLNEMRYKSMVR